MSISGQGSTNTEGQKMSQFEKYIKEDNIVDITKNDLTELKAELDKSDLEIDNDLPTKLQKLNDDVEIYFGGWLTQDSNREKNITLTIDGNTLTDTPKNIIMRGNQQELNALANYVLDLSEYEKKLDYIKNEEIKTVLSTYEFELKNLRGEVTGEGETTIEGGSDSQYEQNEQIPGQEKLSYEEEMEHYIDPTNVQATKIESYSYFNFEEFDKNNDNTMSNKELKNAGIVNRYRNNNSDKNTAIFGILNKDTEEIFKKSNIRGINRDDLTEIMDEMLDPLAFDSNSDGVSLLDLVYEATDENGNFDKQIFKNLFKAEFKKRFIKTKKYTTKGIFGETDKIANIIVTAIENESDTAFRDALERLADVGDAAKNLDYTAAWNNNVLLEHIDSNDVFLFLCDFDSDGVVNSTDIPKKDKKDKKRRDTGSVMGGQMYTNFLLYADTEWKNIDHDPEEEKIIVDGQKTSDLIVRLLNAAANETENDLLRDAISRFISTHTANDGQITMEAFTAFMKEGIYTNTSGEEIKVSGAADIKEFIKSLADQLNEGKDLSRLFLDKDVIQQHTKTNALHFRQLLSYDTNIYQNISTNESMEGNVFLKNIPSDNKKIVETTTQKSLDTFISESNLQKEFNKDMLTEVRNTCVYNTFKVINLVTDLIYLKLGSDAVRTLAGIFEGATIGGITYNFYRPDGTINEKKVHQALTGFIAERFVPTIGLGLGENGKPILGAGLHFEKLDDDLGNKFFANVATSVDLKSLFSGGVGFNFDISGGKAWQTNEKNVKRLTTKKPIPVNRIGVEGGLNFSTLKDLGLYVGLFFERDFPAGIEQKARYYDSIMKKTLGLTDGALVPYEDKNTFKSGLEGRVSSLAGDDADIKGNKEFLHDMIKKIANEMELAGIFDLIKNETDPQMKQAILHYMYTTFIDAFHENAIEQRSYEQLTNNVKLTKFGLKTSISNIIMWTAAGGGVGTAISPVIGTILGAATGMVVGMTQFSTWKSSYVEDAFGKGRRNYSNIETGIGAEYHEELLETEDLETLKTFLEVQLNPNEKLLNITIEDNKIVITGNKYTPDGTIITVNPLKYMNVYYNTDLLVQSGFTFDETTNKLIIGSAPIRVARNVKRDKVETFLILGDDVSGKMTKLSSTTGNAPETVKEIAKEEYFKDMDKQQMQTFVEANANLKPYATKILEFFENDGSLKENENNIPAGLQGTKVNIGTLTFKENIDGEVKITSYDNTTPENKLQINYIIEEEAPAETIVPIDGKDYHEILSTPTPKLLEVDDKLKNVFTPVVEKQLSVFEDAYVNSLYPEFMLSTLNDSLDGFIDEENYEEAFIKLKEIFEKSDSYNTAPAGSDLDQFKSLINDSGLTVYDKAFIVDKCKAIFSYISTLTDGVSDGYQVPWERTYYTSLLGPDNHTVYPLSNEYKQTLQKNIQQTQQLYRTPVNNLIGFTGFYRLDDNRGRRFSMTALGGTNVLSNGNLEQSMIKIQENNDLEKSKERFINNLNVNTINQKILVKKLNAQLESQDIQITTNDLPTLFDGGNLSIDNGKKILKLNVSYYFYLLGECANESIGATIDSIQIYEQMDGKYKETTITGATDGISDERWNIKVETQTLNADYDMVSNQRDLTVSGAFTGLWKKPQAEGEVGENKTPSNDNSTGSSGEGKDESDATLGPGGSQLGGNEGNTDDNDSPIAQGG